MKKKKPLDVNIISIISVYNYLVYVKLLIGAYSKTAMLFTPLCLFQSNVTYLIKLCVNSKQRHYLFAIRHYQSYLYRSYRKSHTIFFEDLLFWSSFLFLGFSLYKCLLTLPNYFFLDLVTNVPRTLMHQNSNFCHYVT